MRDETKIKQIVYTSQASDALPDGELQRILDTARTNNQKLGVTGFLLFDGRAFVQLLEGSEEALTELYARITEDPRHRAPHVIVERLSTTRFLSNWSMAYAYLDANENGVFGGTFTREKVWELANMLRSGNRDVRSKIADTLVYLAGNHEYRSKTLFDMAERATAQSG